MNRVVELISLLRSLNVKLRVEGDDLRLSAPPDSITPELRQELALYKPELIAFVRESTQSAKGRQAAIQAQSESDNRPLSFSQEQLWFIWQMEPESPIYNVPQAFRLYGPVDFLALQDSIARIIARHESLRTIYKAENGVPRQVVLPSGDFTLQRIQTDDWQTWLNTETNRPFNLEHGPLLRVTLLQLGQADHILFTNIHHIATDGWSASVFLREISTNYAALLQGKEPDLPDLPIQYSDFAHWQRDWLQSEIITSQVNYWREQLKHMPAVLELPTDKPRPANLTYRGTTLRFPIPPELLNNLQAFSAQQGVTLFMSFLAAFEVLLYRHTHQEKFILGTPVANRSRSETEAMIGYFINTIVLRADIDKKLPFLELLRDVRDTCLGAYSHQDVPFEKLVAELNLVRNISHNPLFQAMFVLQNTPAENFVLQNLRIEEIFLATETSKFDLTFSITQTNQGDFLNIQYSTDLFEQATIERMAGHYLRLLDGILLAPEQKIIDLPLLTNEEIQQLVVTWNSTKADYSENRCFHELFEEQVEQTPESVALVFENQTLTYRALNERANQIAYYLRTVGVGPESRVGILLERSSEVIVAMMAILKAGGAYVPIDPSLPSERIGVIIEESQSDIVITQACFQSLLSENMPMLVIDTQWVQIAGYPTINPPSLARPENLIYILFTSGSTGAPKGVAIEHRQVYNYLKGIVKRLDLPVDAHYALISTFAADLGNTVIFPALSTGGTLYILSYMQALNPHELADTFSYHSIDCLKIVPSHLRAILNAENAVDILPRRCLVLGGEALDWELVKYIRQIAPACRIFNHYGPTETTVGVLTYHVPEQFVPSSKNVPLGRPIENTKMFILDPDGQLAPIGVPGELYIGGSGVGRGYINSQKLTDERFLANRFETLSSGRLYKTGDLVRYLPDGNIEFIGRLDNQVKIRGFRVELSEIETLLGQHSQVQSCVVAAREDANGDKYLAAYVVPQNKVAPPTSTDLREYLKIKLPKYMLPGVFVILEQLPLTSNGKVDRKALPEPDKTALFSTAEYVPPQTPTEQILAEILAKLLGVQRVGKYDNFFELGGDSITSLQFVSRAQARGLYLTPRHVFEAQTINDLAAIAETHISRQVSTQKIMSSRPLLADSQVAQPYGYIPGESLFATLTQTELDGLGEQGKDIADIYPLSPLQSVMLFQSIESPKSGIYFNQNSFNISGRLDPARFKAAWQEVVNRHTILRTSFAWQGLSSPVQIVHRQASICWDEQDWQTIPSFEKNRRFIQLLKDEREKGFELTQAPLLRFTLIRVAEDNFWFAWHCHHILRDGWSAPIILRELLSLYKNPALILPEPLPYRDYIAWLTQQNLINSQKFWQEQMLGFTKPTSLPGQKQGQSSLTRDYTKINITLSPELTSALQAFSQRHHLTLNTLCQGAWALVLHQYSQENEVVFGVTVSGRSASLPGIESRVGVLMNTLPLRVKITLNQPWQQWLQALMQEQNMLEQYAYTPIDQLQAWIGIPAGQPLFLSNVRFQNHPSQEIDMRSDALLKIEDFISVDWWHYPLNLIFIPGSRLELIINYDTNRFEPDVMRQMLQSLETVLSRFSQSEPGKSVNAILS